MLEKCSLFTFRGFYTITPQEFTLCEERNAYMLRYLEVPGVSLSHIPADRHEPTAILLGSWLNHLHSEGVYLKDIRQTNIQILPNGSFILLNPTNCEFFDCELKVSLREKDRQQMMESIALLKDSQRCRELFIEQYQMKP